MLPSDASPEVVFILLVPLFFLIYGGLGALFGYAWPNAGWKWGLWLVLIPFLLVWVVNTQIAPTGSVVPTLMLLLGMPSLLSGCIAAGLAAKYSRQTSQQRVTRRRNIWLITIPVALLLVASGITLAILSASSTRRQGCPTITATCRHLRASSRNSALDGSGYAIPALMQPAWDGAEFQVTVSYDNLHSAASHLTASTQALALQAGDVPSGVSSIRWTVSAGRIESGQGTTQMYVDTTGLAGRTIRATADVRMQDNRCSEVVSCSVLVPGH